MSGYLSALKYYDSGIASHKQLVMKRLKTYYPIHIMTLLCNLVLTFRASWSIKKFITLILNIFLLQSYMPVSEIYFSFNAVSWYLSLTMFFALITPAALKFIHDTEKHNSVIKSIIFLCMFQFIWCALAVMMPKRIQHWLVYVSPFVRSIDFVLGGLLFVFLRSHKVSNKCFLPSVIAEIVLLIVSRKTGGEFFSACAWTILNLIIMACILENENASSFISKIFTNKLAVYIGNISLEFFMLHTLVLSVTGRIFSRFVYISALILTVLSAGICSKIMHKLFRREALNG